MSNSRRDFLQGLFSTGAVIVPFVGGSQVAVARLIEIPKIEIIEPPKDILTPFSRHDVVGAEVILKMRDGTTRRQEHFDFSYYPIDFKKQTIRLLELQEARKTNCPNCGEQCVRCKAWGIR
jgi:hypothetical protein